MAPNQHTGSGESKIGKSITRQHPVAQGLGINEKNSVIDVAKQVIQAFLLVIIRGYQGLISPYLGNHCRYYPSCSSYAGTAIRCFGPFTGSMMAIKRLLRCHPFHAGGYDPVPEPITAKKD
ncbi:MAG: membrane protein insertion efficiency factor YidD [Gammaproteobacteria bacterium]|nr:membrane protein insertion efficiency factor YidD [Gammaproteobacteria bacterium]